MRVTDALAVVGSLQFGLSGPLDCHVYALRGDRGLVLIDAGGGTHTDQLLKNAFLDFSGASVAAVLITHCHVDHCGGSADIRQRTRCQIIAPELCRVTLETADEEGAARHSAWRPSGFSGPASSGVGPDRRH